MVKRYGEFCPNCLVELEDHGHTYSNEYITKYLCCTKCGADFDFDSRRKKEWQPRPPLFEIEVPEEKGGATEGPGKIPPVQCSICGEENAHYLSEDDIDLCEKCFKTKRGPDGHFPGGIALRLNPWEQQFVGGFLDYFLEDMTLIAQNSVFLKNHPLPMSGTKNMIPLVARLKQKVGSKDRKEGPK